MKKEIIEKLKLCKPEQINIFRRMYCSSLPENSKIEDLVNTLPKSEYKSALSKIELTLKKNSMPEIKKEVIVKPQIDYIEKHCVEFAWELFNEVRNEYPRNSNVVGCDFDGKKYYVKGNGYWEKAHFIENLKIKGVDNDYFKEIKFLML